MKKSIPLILIVTGIVVLGAGLAFAFNLSSEADISPYDVSKANSSARLSFPLPDADLELDPRNQVSMNLKAVSNAMFSRLVRISEGGEVEPDLAESWSFDFNQREVILKIRSGVTFHDGTPLTIDDVLASFLMWLSPGALDNNLLLDIEGAEEFTSGKTNRVSGIRKIDEKTLGVKLLKRFTEDFVYALTTPRFYIYKKETASGRMNLVGTGPFQLGNVTNGSLTLKRFDKYFGKIAAASELEFYTRDREGALADLLSGRAHALFAYSDLPWKDLEGKDVRVLPIKKTTTSILFFMNQGMAQSLNFRKSIAAMFNRELIRDTCFPGGTLATRLIPPGLRGSTQTATPQPTSQPPGLPPIAATLPILFSTTLESGCLRSRLTSDYGKHGGKLHEFSSLEKLYEYFKQGHVDFAFERMTFKSLDPANVLQYFNPASAEYFLKEEVPELRALFRDLASAEASNQKSKVMGSIDEFLVENAFVVPLVHETFYTALSRKLTGFTQIDFGNIVSMKWEDLGLDVSR